jgi:hypothetical protein
VASFYEAYGGERNDHGDTEEKDLVPRSLVGEQRIE